MRAMASGGREPARWKRVPASTRPAHAGGSPLAQRSSRGRARSSYRGSDAKAIVRSARPHGGRTSFARVGCRPFKRPTPGTTHRVRRAARFPMRCAWSIVTSGWQTARCAMKSACRRVSGHLPAFKDRHVGGDPVATDLLATSSGMVRHGDLVLSNVGSRSGKSWPGALFELRGDMIDGHSFD